MNLLQLLHQYGQSVWLEGFERGWINRGELQRYIEEDGLTGVRSGFQSLRLAIEGQEYDRDFNTLAQRGSSRSARSDYEYLLVRDLQLAADRLKQIHVQSQGRNGYVQVDLPPDTLFDAETAITAAQKIWRTVGWSNLLLRIPATRLTLPVIEHLIGAHINVNATLVFSPSMYDQVFDCYLRGLEKLVQQGECASSVVCFVSMSVGHLDRVIDPLSANAESFSLMQTKLLYQHHQHLCRRKRSLPEGVNPPRLVWDCTAVLPESVWHYLPSLATPETVMLLSPSTLEKYREGCLLPVSLTEHEQAGQWMTSELSEIALNEQVDQFVNKEIMRSLNTFQQLLDTIEHKRRQRSWMDIASMVNCP